MKRASAEVGVTLIELMIAITLVALLSTGMLMAMHTGLMTLEKTDARLQSNRRVMSVEQILTRQLGGVIPALGACASSGGPPAMISAFNGTAESLHMVSTYSLSEGARGYPRILEFQVVPAEGGGLRLIVNESLYTGPASMSPFCLDLNFLPAVTTPQSFVLADRLASCQLWYREAIPDSPVGGNWQQVWNRPNLPSAVRVDMTPLVPDPAHLPLIGVTVPIHITRDVGAPYADTQP